MIDVIRAITNVAFAFSHGVEGVLPVSTIGEAMALKRRGTDILIAGQDGRLPPEGFDFGNSPAQMEDLELTGRPLVLRTGASGRRTMHRSFSTPHGLSSVDRISSIVRASTNSASPCR